MIIISNSSMLSFEQLTAAHRIFHSYDHKFLESSIKISRKKL